MEVSVGRHENFVRQDMDIFSNVDISFAQAALGCDLRVSTVDGDVIYSVKPGTQSGTRVRLKGKGVPSLRNKNVRGDHYVTLTVRIPTRLSEEAKKALREYDLVSGNTLNQEVEKESKETKETKETGKGKKKNFFDKLKDTFED